jgi:hypothetical protein
MDIFKYADDIDWKADYMDMNTYYTYAIIQAEDHDHIPVFNGSVFLGVVVRNK